MSTAGERLKSSVEWLAFFWVLVSFLSGVVCETEDLSPPTARIVAVKEGFGVTRTVTDRVNHEVVLSHPLPGESYLFQCNATYPVEWNYFGEGAPATNADVGRYFTDFYNVNTYTYQAVLVMRELEELLSGRYVCRGTMKEQERLQVQYDLFVPGNGSRVLISNGEKKIFVPESKVLVSLPCEVADPSFSINLYKENHWGGYQKLDLNDSIVFRPRKGFILKMHELPNPFGTYVCTTRDGQQRRKIHLIPEQFRDKYDDHSGDAQQSKIHLSFDYEQSRMLCCNANGQGQGQVLAPKLQWAQCGSVVDCKIKSVCFEEDRCGSPAFWRDPGPLPRGCAGWKMHEGPEGDFGIFKCSMSGAQQYQPYLFNRGNIFVDFDNAPPSESILTLTRSSVDPIYLGSEVEYNCNSTRFYFAFGIRWAFKRGNDEIEFIQDSSSYIVKDDYPLVSHSRKTKFRILQPDIKAIICFVPIANSATEWRTVSLPISIRDSFHYPAATVATTRQPPLEFLMQRGPIGKMPLPPFNPFSTSQPKYGHSAEVGPQAQNRPEPEPTASVDIDEIISLGSSNRRQDVGESERPSQGHVHREHQQQHYHQHQHYQPSPAPNPPQRGYPQPQSPEIITLDSFSKKHSQADHHVPYGFPSPSEIQEANMKHRMKVQHKENQNLAPLTISSERRDTQVSNFKHYSQSRHSSLQAPSSQPEQHNPYAPSPLPTIPSYSQGTSQEASRVRYPLKEFKVSSKLDFMDFKKPVTQTPSVAPPPPPTYNRPKPLPLPHPNTIHKGQSPSQSSPALDTFASSSLHHQTDEKQYHHHHKHQHYQQRPAEDFYEYPSKLQPGQMNNFVRNHPSYIQDMMSKMTEAPPTTKAPVVPNQQAPQVPQRHYKPQGQTSLSEGGSSSGAVGSTEGFSAPVPVQPYGRQPVIHYDSSEKQYSLRDPLMVREKERIVNIGPSSQESSQQYSRNPYEARPAHEGPSHSAQQSYHHHHHHGEEDKSHYYQSQSLPPYPEEDYYLSSLRAKQATKGSSSSKSKGGSRPRDGITTINVSDETEGSNRRILSGHLHPESVSYQEHSREQAPQSPQQYSERDPTDHSAPSYKYQY